MKTISEFIQEQDTRMGYSDPNDITKEYVECMAALSIAQAYTECSQLMGFAEENGINRISIVQEAASENKESLIKRMGNAIVAAWDKIVGLFKKIWGTIAGFFRGKRAEAKLNKIQGELKKADKEIPGTEKLAALIQAGDIKIKNTDVTFVCDIDALATFTEKNDAIKTYDTFTDSGSLVMTDDQIKTINDGIEYLEKGSENKLDTMTVDQFIALVNITKDALDEIADGAKVMEISNGKLERLINKKKDELKAAVKAAYNKDRSENIEEDKFGNKLDPDIAVFMTDPTKKPNVDDPKKALEEFEKGSKATLDVCKKLATALSKRVQSIMKEMNTSAGDVAGAAEDGVMKRNNPKSTQPVAELESFYFV